jgi:hypothetical protein
MWKLAEVICGFYLRCIAPMCQIKPDLTGFNRQSPAWHGFGAHACRRPPFVFAQAALRTVEQDPQY